MKRVPRIVSVVVVGAVLCASASVVAAAQQTPYWPSERAERLDQIQTRIVDAMRELNAASYNGRDEDAAKLVEEIEALKSEQELLSEPPVHAESAPR
jgi:hypothetical protein